MIESLDSAREELKRADHLIYVSLKYTRTCDIFKSIIERLINSIEFMIAALLKKLEEDKKIDKIPSQLAAKCASVKENYNDPEINKILDFHLLLRQINRAPFKRMREFRRHVAMIVEVNGKPVEVNIDNITEYFKNVKLFYEYVDKKVRGENPKEE